MDRPCIFGFMHIIGPKAPTALSFLQWSLEGTCNESERSQTSSVYAKAFQNKKKLKNPIQHYPLNHT